MSNKFPKTLHVTQEVYTPADTFRCVQENGMAGIESDGEEVAVYELKAVYRLKVTKELVGWKKK
jgi:hypothetical protein